MDLIEIIKDSVKYPFSDIKTLLIIGVIFLIMSICGSIGGIIDNDAVAIVGAIISFILLLIITGYSLDVLEFAIELNDSMPSLDIKNNIINGIKLIIVNIVYFIIPSIILIIVALISGGYAVASLSNINITNPANPTEVISAIMTPEMIYAIGVIIVVAIILYIIFGLLALMGQARLAKTGDIGNAVSFSQSYRDLRTIGVGKTIALFILLMIVIFVILLIMMIILIIPILGAILVALLGDAIIMFIQYRAYGLLYSEV